MGLVDGEACDNGVAAHRGDGRMVSPVDGCAITSNVRGEVRALLWFATAAARVLHTMHRGSRQSATGHFGEPDGRPVQRRRAGAVAVGEEVRFHLEDLE